MTLFLVGSALAGALAGASLKATGLVFLAGAGSIAGTATLIGMMGPAAGLAAAATGILAFNVGLGVAYGARAAHRARRARERAAAARSVMDRRGAAVH